MTDERHRRPGGRPLIVTIALLGALAAIWILGTVPSGGPDEPVHLVRGAALVRGQVDGEKFAGAGRVFEVPAWIGHPDHACFSLIETQPANCATNVPRPSGEALLVTTSWSYPIWGHLAPGLGTYFPASVGNQMARVFDAVIPIALIGAVLVLARRRGPAAVAATALAVTPMAWFSIIVVNPSGLVIAGGLALWAALLDAGPDHVPLDRLTSWTIAAGWAAAVLPRRDGMIWATLILALCVAVGVVDLRSLVRRVGHGPLALITASSLATLAWAATSDTSSSQLLIATPAIPLAGAGLHRLWVSDVLADRNRRAATVVIGVAGAALGCFATMSLRSQGFDGDLLERIVGQTGLNLEEAIGLLGWLDAPLPRTALFVWIAAFGVLAGVALGRGHSGPVGLAVAIIGIGAVSAWVLEMNQGNTSGTYWQGRYSLPFLIGAPLVLGWLPRDRPATDSNDRSPLVVVGAALTVMTMAFGSSMRRWGAGTAGSLDPRDWDTYGAALPPWLLLLGHIAIVGALFWMAVEAIGARNSEVSTLTAHDA